MQKDYHFSAQFTADLISMNTADFIIASTYRECQLVCVCSVCGMPPRQPRGPCHKRARMAAEEIAGVKGGVAGQYESHSFFTVSTVHASAAYGCS